MILFVYFLVNWSLCHKSEYNNCVNYRNSVNKSSNLIVFSFFLKCQTLFYIFTEKRTSLNNIGNTSFYISCMCPTMAKTVNWRNIDDSFKFRKQSNKTSCGFIRTQQQCPFEELQFCAHTFCLVLDFFYHIIFSNNNLKFTPGGQHKVAVSVWGTAV